MRRRGNQSHASRDNDGRRSSRASSTPLTTNRRGPGYYGDNVDSQEHSPHYSNFVESTDDGGNLSEDGGLAGRERPGPDGGVPAEIDTSQHDAGDEASRTTSSFHTAQAKLPRRSRSGQHRVSESEEPQGQRRSTRTRTPSLRAREAENN